MTCCLGSVLSVWVFIVVTVGICNIGCFCFHSQVEYSLDYASGYLLLSAFFTPDLNITAVVDAENCVVVSNQGGRSGVASVDFLIQALAKGSGRHRRF